MIDVTRLREKRQSKLDEAEALIVAAEGENRGLTEDEQRLYDELIAKAEELRGRIDRAEQMNQRQREQQQAAGQPPMHQRNQPTQPNGDGGEGNANIGMNNREVQEYRLSRAILAQATGNWANAGLELEASRAVAQQLGREPNGFFVPFDVQQRQGPPGEQRDLNVGTATAGGHTVATDLLAQNFIDLLRNRLVVRQAGATVLTGLVGDIAIPRQTGGATAYWVAESGAPTEGQQAFDQVALSPETVGAFTDYSRKLLIQSSIDVENFIRTDLSSVIGIEVDRASIHGSGASNQPTGVENVSGIGSVAIGANGGAPTWDHVVDLETEVAIDNADVGRLAYLTNTKVRGKLKKTQHFSGTDGMPVWDKGSMPLNGYAAPVTNQVRSDISKGTGTNLSAIFFANWADLILAFWSGLDILVDPFTGGTSGTVRVIALQDVDVAVRHPESFAAILDADTA